jgi:HK97 family phage major capsid protein
MAGDKTLMRLHEQRCELLRRGDELVQRAEAEGRNLSDDEQTALDGYLAEMKDLDAERARLELERGSGAGLSLGGAWGTASAPARVGSGAGSARSASYRDLFPNALSAGGFKHFGQFLTQIDSGLYSPELHATMMGGDSNGTGFLIPGQFSARLLDESLEDEIVRPRARPEPMTSDTKTIAGLTHDDGTLGPYGGLGGWVAEAATIAEEDAPVRAIQLHAHAVKVLVRVSNEALADGQGLEEQLTTALPKALGWHMDTGFLRGTGAGQPIGILNAPATITVAKEGSQPADTIVYANLTKMFARLAPASVRNAVWVVNPSAIPQLLTLSQTVGTGGSLVPVLSESNGNFRMLAIPVIFSEKCSALGDLGDIILADFSQYAVGLRAEVRLEKSMHAGFASDTSHFRAVLRADGQPLLAAPYTMAHGGTVSPFVTLAERA